MVILLMAAAAVAGVLCFIDWKKQEKTTGRLIKSFNDEFLNVMDLKSEDFHVLDSSEFIMYRSGKYGPPTYILKILIDNGFVIEYRKPVESYGDTDSLLLSSREIIGLQKDSTGRVRSIRYGKGGEILDIIKFRELMQDEIIRLTKSGGSNDPDMIKVLPRL